MSARAGFIRPLMRLAVKYSKANGAGFITALISLALLTFINTHV